MRHQTHHATPSPPPDSQQILTRSSIAMAATVVKVEDTVKRYLVSREETNFHEDDSNATKRVLVENKRIKRIKLKQQQQHRQHQQNSNSDTSTNKLFNNITTQSIDLDLESDKTNLVVAENSESIHETTDQIKTELGLDTTDTTTTDPTMTTSIKLTRINQTTLTDVLDGQTSDQDEEATSTHNTHQRPPMMSIDRHERLTQAQLDRLSSLIKIIRNGDYVEFLEMLERRGFKGLLNVFIDGQTALHYSLIYGRSLAWCKLLVLNGANPNLTNRAGWHPIHLAAFNGSRETMRYLIDCLAN